VTYFRHRRALVSGSLRYFGGRYTALPWYPSSVSILSMFANLGSSVELSRISLTYFSVVMYSVSAPQKVRPRPMKARTEDSRFMEKAMAIKPRVNRNQLTSLVGLVLCEA